MTTKFEPIADDLLVAFEADCADSQDRDRRSNLPGQSTVMMKYFGQTIARLRRAETVSPPLTEPDLLAIEEDAHDLSGPLPGNDRYYKNLLAGMIARVRRSEAERKTAVETAARLGEQVKRLTTFAELARLEVKHIFDIATMFGWDEKTSPEPAASFLSGRLILAEAKIAAVNMDLLKDKLETGMQSCARAIKEGWVKSLPEMRAEMPNATEAEVARENATAAAVASYSLGFCEVLVAIRAKAEEITARLAGLAETARRAKQNENAPR